MDLLLWKREMGWGRRRGWENKHNTCNDLKMMTWVPLHHCGNATVANLGHNAWHKNGNCGICAMEFSLMSHSLSPFSPPTMKAWVEVVLKFWRGGGIVFMSKVDGTTKRTSKLSDVSVRMRTCEKTHRSVLFHSKETTACNYFIPVILETIQICSSNSEKHMLKEENSHILHIWQEQ